MFFATGESEKKNGEKVKNHEVNKIDGCERCEYGVSMEYVIIEGGDYGWYGSERSESCWMWKMMNMKEDECERRWMWKKMWVFMIYGWFGL